MIYMGYMKGGNEMDVKKVCKIVSIASMGLSLAATIVSGYSETLKIDAIVEKKVAEKVAEILKKES